MVEFTKSLPVLPYRDEEDASLQAIKDERNIKVREKLIKEQLKKINNSTMVNGCELSPDITKYFMAKANEIIKENKANGRYKGYPSLACSEVTFSLNFNRGSNPFVSVVFDLDEVDDDIMIKTAFYEDIRKVVPEQYDIKINMEW